MHPLSSYSFRYTFTYTSTYTFTCFYVFFPPHTIFYLLRAQTVFLLFSFVYYSLCFSFDCSISCLHLCSHHLYFLFRFHYLLSSNFSFHCIIFYTFLVSTIFHLLLSFAILSSLRFHHLLPS